jgi:hypothetical protein
VTPANTLTEVVDSVDPLKFPILSGQVPISLTMGEWKNLRVYRFIIDASSRIDGGGDERIP